MKLKKFKLSLVLLTLIGVFVSPVIAKRNTDTIHIVVKTILASQEASYVDPQLSTLIEELQHIFRYSSYQLISKNSLDLGMKRTGIVSLPGNRVLKITPTGFTQNRTELQLVIFRKRKQIFQTVIQILNHGSITVGGPKYRNGYLLFNIFTSF
ncbi:MAG: hypothetical protein SVW57_13575 [Thermodesulfobacteriota bacterium]|nr:hypothetical protein [Thermodesulfobacteriota bacterium]